MLKIHKSHSKSKVLIIPITSICIVAGLLGFYHLTYTPELSYAEAVTSKKTIDDITYMQEMTSEICKSMELEKQYQLTDIRKNFDGVQPKYWIARLKDGNCWMTQNLDLDIPAEGLSEKDTDILEDWNNITNHTYYPSATQTGNPSGFSNNSVAGQGSQVVVSYDPGVKICIESNKTCAEPTTNTYDEHFLQGNIYTFNAAVAGKANTVSGDNVSIDNSSICPKGWQLPLAGLLNASTDSPTLVVRNKSFAYLLEAYGWQWDQRYYAANLTGGTGYNILSAPFHYIYSGYIYNDAVSGEGTEGRFWSSVLRYGAPFMLKFSSDVYPSALNYSPFQGSSVRCIARSESIPNNNVNITINNTISLDVTNEIEVKKSDTNPSTAAFSALVASNQPYSVSISSANPNMTSSTSSTTIPSKSGTLTSNDNAWGIKLSTASTYEQITTTPKLFYSSSNPESKSLPFTIGISTAPDLPSGEYSTDITITATQN